MEFRSSVYKFDIPDELSNVDGIVETTACRHTKSIGVFNGHCVKVICDGCHITLIGYDKFNYKFVFNDIESFIAKYRGDLTDKEAELFAKEIVTRNVRKEVIELLEEHANAKEIVRFCCRFYTEVEDEVQRYNKMYDVLEKAKRHISKMKFPGGENDRV